VRAPVGAACIQCDDPSAYLMCTCPVSHTVCEECALDTVRRGALGQSTLRCPFSEAPGAGAAERGFTGCIVSEELVEYLAAHPPARGAALTRAEMERFTRLGLVNAARLSGSLAHACPRGACPGLYFGDQRPPAGAPGERVECDIGRRAGSSAQPCPAAFCAICGETWDPLHEGKACGRWREEAPPPKGMKLCPWCKVPSREFRREPPRAPEQPRPPQTNPNPNPTTP
jgi:hypothetical protein